MSLVVDASVVVTALVSLGEEAAWAEAVLRTEHPVAPALMPAEAANALRRVSRSGLITAEVASQAHAELLELGVELAPYEPFGRRVWELRETLTAYDAWYVAVAEALDPPLATLDLRLARAPGPRCEFRVPPGRA